MKINSFGHITLLAAALTSLAPTGAKAQNEETNRLYNLEKVTITATRTPRPVALTPEKVNVITRDTMQRRVVQDFEDIFKYEPGVNTSGGPRGIGQRPNIRGLSGDRVLQRVDGARMNFDSGHKGQTFIEPAWLQRVEIIRGPSSALYGSGGLGGAVSYRTVEAGDLLAEGEKTGVSLQTGYALANEEFHVIPMTYGRLADGDLEYLLSFNGRWAGAINTGGDNADLGNSSFENHSGLAKLVYHPWDGTTFKLSTLQFNSDIGVPPNTSSTGPTVVDRHTRQSVYNLEFEHAHPETSWLNLSGNLYSTMLDIEETQNTDGRVDEIEFDTLGLNLLNRQPIHEADSLGLDLTYGLEYFTDNQNSKRNGGLNGFFPDAESDHIAGYAQGEFSALEGTIELIPGARLDQVGIDGAGGLSNQETELSPKVGAVIKLDDEIGLRDGDYLALAGNYSEGFRAPSFSELFASGIHFPGAVFAPNATLRPETSRNFEFGPRLKLDKFEGSFNYFETRAEDFIDFNVTFTPPFGPLVFTPVNVADAKLRGVEMEGRYELNESWGLWANYTRVRGENATTGAPLTSVAPEKVIVGLDYTLASHGITTGLRASYNGKQDRLPAGAPPSYEYTVVDLLASWRPARAQRDFGAWKRWEFNFAIDNLLDRGHTQFLGGLPEAGVNPKASVVYRRSF